MKAKHFAITNNAIGTLMNVVHNASLRIVSEAENCKSGRIPVASFSQLIRSCEEASTPSSDLTSGAVVCTGSWGITRNFFVMDKIDRLICGAVQSNGRAAIATVAEAAGVPTSTANDRLRKLVSNGTICGWRAVLDVERVGAGLACFVLIDVVYDGEEEAVSALCERPEVMELHHISGAHSYLAKLRVPDMAAIQVFLTNYVKPLRAVVSTETIFALETCKETSEVLVTDDLEDKCGA